MADDVDTIGLVLLHGSELGSWIWEPVVPLLRHPAVAVDLPGRGNAPLARADVRGLGVDDAVASVTAQAAALGDRPLMVVAHSFSGVLVPGLLDRLGDRVRAVVWLAATVPAAGRSWVDLQPAPQRQILRLLYRLRPAGLRSPRRESLALLCNDLDEATAAAVVDRRVAEVPGFLLDRVTSAVPASMTSHVVHLHRDLAQSEAVRTASYDRLAGPQVHGIDSGHLPMLSRPAELAAILESIAAAHESSAPPSAAGAAVPQSPS